MPEEEDHGSLPFLDLTVTRPDTALGRPFSLEVFRKAMHADRYIHFRSAHPFSQKRTVFRGFLIRAYRLLRKHPVSLQWEISHLQKAFNSPKNGYPRAIIQKWTKNFKLELERKPSLLDLPVKRTAQHTHSFSKTTRTDSQMVPLEASKEVNEDGTSQDVADEGNGRLLNGKPWLLMVIAPYVPGFSERLRSLSAKFGIRSWYSYGGKTRDSVCHFKDPFHYSKAHNSVYSVSCAVSVISMNQFILRSRKNY